MSNTTEIINIPFDWVQNEKNLQLDQLNISYDGQIQDPITGIFHQRSKITFLKPVNFDPSDIELGVIKEYSNASFANSVSTKLVSQDIPFQIPTHKMELVRNEGEASYVIPQLDREFKMESMYLGPDTEYQTVTEINTGTGPNAYTVTPIAKTIVFQGNPTNREVVPKQNISVCGVPSGRST